MILEPSQIKRKLFFVLLDIIIILASVYLSFNLRFDFYIPVEFYPSILLTMFSIVFIRVSFFYVYRIYDISWRHFGFRDTANLVYLVVFSTTILLIVSYLIRGTGYTIPRSIIPIEFFISLFFILLLRSSKRIYIENHILQDETKSTIIIASLDNANNILKVINSKESDYHPIAIINELHSNIKVNGVDVYTLEEFSSLKISCDSAIVDESINIPSIYDRLIKLDIKNIKIAGGYSSYGAKIKNISLEDLLARHPKDLDKKKIALFIKNKTILITGAGGSIGSEICRQCQYFKAKKLILVDNCEYNLYKIGEELKDIEISLVMQDVKNRELIDKTYELYRPDIVIHAAAYKHVPLVELNIQEAILNNVIGTKNIIDLSIKYGIEKVVLISTDKAVRPTNIMGTTKRICELYAQNSNGKGTDIVAVRFGNVLGSSGSVIPKFKSQIEKGENITVTHPDITRYFMLIPEACELVLQAGAIGSGGEIFILDMGKSIKIVDLARKMIELSGRDDIDIEFIGLRKGEKLYEELLIDESDCKTEYESITVAKPTYYNIDNLNDDISKLLVDEDKIVGLKKIVPEFEHKLNLKL